MSARHARALAILVLACVLGGAGCGGGKNESAALQARTAARWRSGLLTWNHRMLHALDEISLLLSTQEAIATLDEPHSKVRSALAPFELTLAGCSATVERLGPEPQALAAARGYALAACANLERGDRLIEAAVHGLSSGAGGDLESATAPLSDGQSEMMVATQTLAPSSAPANGSG